MFEQVDVFNVCSHVRHVGPVFRWGEHQGEEHGVWTGYHPWSPARCYRVAYHYGKEVGVDTRWNGVGEGEYQVRYQPDGTVEERDSPPWWDGAENQKLPDGTFTADPGNGEEGRRQVLWKNGRIVAEVQYPNLWCAHPYYCQCDPE